MKKAAKPVYRVNDVIEIVEPQIFVRCGYPLHPSNVRAEVKELCRDEIDALLVKAGCKDSVSTPSVWLDADGGASESDAFAEILTKLCYAVVRARGFGGNTRSVHTELREDLRGKRARVQSKRNVKTGERYAPSGGYSSYYGEWESEPGGLSDCETHVILECQLLSGQESFTLNMPFEIEARHVRAEPPIDYSDNEAVEHPFRA